MITVPEEMGFAALDGFRKRILSVKAKGPFGRRKKVKHPPRYAVTRAEAQRFLDRRAPPGQRPAEAIPGAIIPASAVIIPEVDIKEEPTTQRYVRPVAWADSVGRRPNEVMVVGPNMIRPTHPNPELAPVRGKVVVPTPRLVDEGDGVEILPEVEEFTAETDEVNIPGLPSRGMRFQEIPPPRHPYPPAMQRMLKKELDVEAEAENMLRTGRPNGEEDMGTLRVDDEVGVDDLDDVGVVDIIASAATAAFSIGKGVYDIRRQKKLDRDAKKQAEVQSAADFEARFNETVAQRYGGGAPQAGAPAPGAPQIMAPALGGSTGPSLTTVLIVAGVAVAGVIGVMLLTRK